MRLIRTFDPEQHIKMFDKLPWENLVDEQGRELAGIRGKSGSRGEGEDGLNIGIDLIEMSPGAAFPLHVHEGDHLLYALSGTGFVDVEKCGYLFCAGTTFFIPAELPHAVSVSPTALVRFKFLAIGHPHKHVTARDRMQIVDKAE